MCFFFLSHDYPRGCESNAYLLRMYSQAEFVYYVTAAVKKIKLYFWKLSQEGFLASLCVCWSECLHGCLCLIWIFRRYCQNTRFLEGPWQPLRMHKAHPVMFMLCFSWDVCADIGLEWDRRYFLLQIEMEESKSGQILIAIGPGAF